MEKAYVFLDSDRHQHFAHFVSEAAKQNPDLEKRAGAYFTSGTLLASGQNPYAVVSEGKQYFIQDAYTTSDRFPYSQPQTTGAAAGINYIRNSVKAVVNMYDGTVSLYVMDPNDPVLAAYRRPSRAY